MLLPIAEKIDKNVYCAHYASVMKSLISTHKLDELTKKQWT